MNYFFLFIAQEKIWFKISSYFIYKASDAYLDFLKLRGALLGLRYWTEYVKTKKSMNPVNDSRKELASLGAVVGKMNYREQNPLAAELARPGSEWSILCHKTWGWSRIQISRGLWEGMVDWFWVVPKAKCSHSSNSFLASGISILCFSRTSDHKRIWAACLDD